MAKEITQEHRVTLRCSTGCKNTFRIALFGLPQTASCGYNYCPCCGAQGVVVSQSIEVTYWESLAESYGYSVDIMKQIYELWDPREHQNFASFLAELQAEALKSQEQLANAS